MRDSFNPGPVDTGGYLPITQAPSKATAAQRRRNYDVGELDWANAVAKPDTGEYRLMRAVLVDVLGILYHGPKVEGRALEKYQEAIRWVCADVAPDEEPPLYSLYSICHHLDLDYRNLLSWILRNLDAPPPEWKRSTVQSRIRDVAEKRRRRRLRLRVPR